MTAQVQLFIQKNSSSVLFCRTTLNEVFSGSVAMSGIAPAWVQHLALGLVELHEVVMDPILELVQVLVDSFASLT